MKRSDWDIKQLPLYRQLERLNSYGVPVVESISSSVLRFACTGLCTFFPLRGKLAMTDVVQSYITFAKIIL